MPYYEFWCDCGFKQGLIRPISKPPKRLKCSECNSRMYREFKVNTGIYKSHIEMGFTGQPIEVTSAKQRDALCKEHGVTPDSYVYSKPKVKKTAIEELNYSEVKERLNNVSDDQLESERRASDDERGRDLGGGTVTQEISISGVPV